PVTKWNARVHDPDIIPEAVRKAFAVAEREKPGATHLELPADVMESPLQADPVPRRSPTLSEPVAAELHRAAELLQLAESPVNWNPKRDLRVICIDTTPAESDAHYVPDVELVGDISHILTHLGNLISEKPPAHVDAPDYGQMIRDALESHSDDGFPVKPQRV